MNDPGVITGKHAEMADAYRTARRASLADSVDRLAGFLLGTADVLGQIDETALNPRDISRLQTVVGRLQGAADAVRTWPSYFDQP